MWPGAARVSRRSTSAIRRAHARRSGRPIVRRGSAGGIGETSRAVPGSAKPHSRAPPCTARASAQRPATTPLYARCAARTNQDDLSDTALSVPRCLGASVPRSLALVPRRRSAGVMPRWAADGAMRAAAAFGMVPQRPHLLGGPSPTPGDADTGETVERWAPGRVRGPDREPRRDDGDETLPRARGSLSSCGPPLVGSSTLGSSTLRSSLAPPLGSSALGSSARARCDSWRAA
jgi:hypothetical protein